MENNFVPELLAPAGSLEALHAAVENGADAVYFGLAGPENFNARVRAENIPPDRLGETMTLLRRRGVKGYVTLNTLVRSDELPAIRALLKEIVRTGVDAIIVQDLGVARLARQCCEELPLHASTQMSLTSLRGIETARSLGLRRVVLPRELSIEQIRELRRTTDIELEVFVHGALCISFSGQCYTSLALGGRSANRGRCAQPCRMAYTLLDGRTDAPVAGFEKPKQLLSPCDLAALPLLPRLVATGLNALKIEGRLKPPEYVAEVTRVYRSALDRIAETGRKTDEKSNDDGLDRLALTFSRGFSTGWLEGVDPRRLVTGSVLSHRGTAVGTVVEVRRDAAVVRLTATVRRGDGILFENKDFPDRAQGGRVYEIFQHRKSVHEAGAGSKVLLTFANDSIDASRVAPGQEVRKTDDPKLQREIRKSLESRRPGRRIPLDIAVRAVAGEAIRIDVRSDSGISCAVGGDAPLEIARKHPVTAGVLREQLGRLGETAYELGALTATIEGNPMIPLSVLGKLRREMIEKLDAAEPPPVLRTFRDDAPRCPIADPGPADCTKTFHLLLRELRFFDADSIRPAIDLGCRSFYAELKRLDDCRKAADIVRKQGGEFVAVLPRILKPGEERVLESFAELGPDAVLARNLDELAFFRDKNIPVVADFSLNAVNELSFQQLLDWGATRITFGWDLDESRAKELLQKIPAERVERIAVGRMPLFTMEHCLWRANLTEPGRPCGQSCETRPLKLRDRRGAIHSVRSDAFCRNVVECSNAIEEHDLSAWTHLRIEWDDRLGDASPLETLRKIFAKKPS